MKGSYLICGACWQVMRNVAFVHDDELTAAASPTADASDGKVMLCCMQISGPSPTSASPRL